MIPSFEDALAELIDRYRNQHNTDVETILSAMEIHTMALEEENDE